MSASGGPPGGAAHGVHGQDGAFYAAGWSPPAPPAPPRRPRVRRRTVVVVSAVVLATALVVAGALGVRQWLALRPLGEVTEPTVAGARQLGPGHCVEDLPSDGPVTQVRVVPCDAPHAAEVLATHLLPDGDYPGDAEVVADVVATCEMDTVQLAAGFRPVVWTPGEAGWNRGDRTGLCLAWHETGAAVGSWTAGDAVTTP